MKNILVVSGHPNPSASLANKAILESLRTAFPQAQFRELASLVKDGHFVLLITLHAVRQD